jgi:hypothetical protein
MLVYINPFLTNSEGHDALFNEAPDNLVKTADDTPYLIKNSNFCSGLSISAIPRRRHGQCLAMRAASRGVILRDA